MTAVKNSREVTVSLPSDQEIVMERVVNAPRELVFDAWTDPKHLPQWMLGPEGWAMPVCEIDLRPGGKWHFEWNKGDGTEMVMHGTYKEVTPPERLVSTENWGGDWPETINTLTLSETDGKTAVTLNLLYPSKEARDKALKTGMKEGMTEGLARLDEYLASIV